MQDMGGRETEAAMLHEPTGPGRRARQAVRLRPASLDDYPQIASLQSRYLLKTESLEEWTHLWLGNPLYEKLQSSWTIGWVLEEKGTKIVGSIANIPLPYEFAGEKIIAATGRAQVIEPAYRSASPLLIDRVINQPGVDVYLNNTVGKNVAPVIDLFGCPRVAAGRWDEAAFWITHYQKCLEIFLLKKHARLAKPLSYPLAPLASLIDRLAKKKLHAGTVQVEDCPGFDRRFDDFWQELRKNNSRRLLAVRTPEVLQWHFRYALLSNQLWISTVVRGRSLIAYAVFLRKDNPALGLKRMVLVDFQSLDGSATLLSPIVCWALKRCRDKGIHILDNVGLWMEKDEFFGTFAPFRRRLTNWVFFYHALNPALAESLRDRRTWTPSLFDGDATL